MSVSAKRRRLAVVAACIVWSMLAPLAQADGLEPGGQSTPAPNDRLFVNEVGDVRVTTAVPSADEARAVFGFRLYRRNVQPVWLRIENHGNDPLWFLPVGLDEAYYTPVEVAYRQGKRGAGVDSPTSRGLYASGMRMLIAPGETRSGYVFSRLDEGTKSFNVDVLGEDEQYLMTFFVPVPGLRVDHYNVDWSGLYGGDERVDVDVAGLVAGLEALPCCVTDKKGRKDGDPLNIAIVGDVEDVYHAFVRAGWDETETIYGSSLLKTARSALFGGEYRYSPVSALYAYGRAQDAALQKARTSINERNHLRLWLTPMRLDGTPVWIGQISRDIGVRFAKRTITTHKIDPDVDETREYLLEDLAYAQSLAGFGYVRGVGAAAFDEPRENLTGDPYFTDGLRVVLFVAHEPTGIDEIRRIDLGARP
jgi:hypothetical protein